MAGPGVLLCSAPPLGTSLQCVRVDVCVSACACACSPLMGGLGVVSRGLSRIPSSRRERREEERWAGGTRFPQLAFGLPLGTGPPSAILPWDFRSLIASLSLSPIIFSFAFFQLFCLSSNPSLGGLYCIPALLQIFALDREPLQVASLVKKAVWYVFGVFVRHVQKWISLFTCIYVCNSVFVF